MRALLFASLFIISFAIVNAERTATFAATWGNTGGAKSVISAATQPDTVRAAAAALAASDNEATIIFVEPKLDVECLTQHSAHFTALKSALSLPSSVEYSYVAASAPVSRGLAASLKVKGYSVACSDNSKDCLLSNEATKVLTVAELKTILSSPEVFNNKVNDVFVVVLKEASCESMGDHNAEIESILSLVQAGTQKYAAVFFGDAPMTQTVQTVAALRSAAAAGSSSSSSSGSNSTSTVDLRRFWTMGIMSGIACTIVSVALLSLGLYFLLTCQCIGTDDLSKQKVL
eukprot:TRINITY_DN1250_c0_g1_i2.p1 TRINITY_DN1250_c0_g1~~TRINITY_DN1250_c0_g1_i2.p1  ORF type:complete len:288 (-),score=48.45 TRINITY_DN1250_c0_g1_i2:59-922(-)